jgi:glutamyl-tRNA synthetase/glutamyl-Q tRNA(Asp) synthetase
MIVSRFAPAPTGYLHLGHVVNAIYVWGLTRAAAGRVLLRIEDHDRLRSRAEFERAILDDLDWLRFIPDHPCTGAFRAGPCEGRQRDREAFYQSTLETLRQRGLIYACECSRSGIAGAASAPGQSSELRYPGTCSGRQLPEEPHLGLRARFNRSIERFDDWQHGPREQCPAEQCGDLLLRDRDGNWTYQFAVTVDDYVQGVTLVIRGDDLLSSTGRQLQLARLLGRTHPPAFLHHPLVMKTATQKLSKADRDTSVRDLRAAGWTPEQVIGEAGAAAGLIEAARPLTREEAGEAAAARYRDRWMTS